MSILLDRTTPVLVQGITGKIGSFHAKEMREYGTNIVGGVTPGKGGTMQDGLPVFDTMKEAVEKTGATASIVFVPPPFAADSIMESADANIRLCVAITDGIPSQDMIRVTRYMRRFDELPGHTDQVFVVDDDEHLKGVLPLSLLIVTDLEAAVAKVMKTDMVTLYPDDKAQEAAQAFERYDLVSAAVVDEAGKLVGRLTIDTVVDYIRDKSESEALAQAGLREEEDIFASVWDSVKNRWAWLAVNLVTAVIGAFEGSIERLVALAALMPIVAGIGGNSGNQTITLIVRAAALGQMQPEHAKKLYRKEMGVALVNGLIWGSLLGLLAWYLYSSVPLGLVMTSAMVLNLLLAATMGVLIPVTMIKLGRDPAVGSSVMITACTDSGGFFIFLGLATLFLL